MREEDSERERERERESGKQWEGGLKKNGNDRRGGITWEGITFGGGAIRQSVTL